MQRQTVVVSPAPKVPSVPVKVAVHSVDEAPVAATAVEAGVVKEAMAVVSISPDSFSALKR